ncbi:gas vesicle structural protein GvpA [Halalkalicoccus paucihalophilus]|uniref:gas vesicle structural protein GvpA n=1 Tax=Halalkalicoccus paucihalophilus TaxID=1008153 RepID=UPI000A07BB7E|nr:gas vesicle structural protein GvpA [Halalkalicoccus paucihalophilus]
MSSARPSTSSLAEILDRILDKGIVVDLWDRISVLGLELITVEAHLVISSIETFLHYVKEITSFPLRQERHRRCR